MSNPAMMQQAQQMMSNPAMQQQMQNQMKNMSGDDLKRNIDAAANQLPNMAGGAPAAPAPAVSASERLRKSAMSIDNDLIEQVVEAENAKTLGNKRFKEGQWEQAAAKYESGAEAVDAVLGFGSLSGGDKKAVYEIKEACHLNLANCRLKLGEWSKVVEECKTVLERPGGASAAGAARKAHFRRGDAYVQLGELEKARDDLKAAKQMDPSDGVVAGKLADVLKQLGEEEECGDVEEVETPGAAASSSSSAATPAMPSMPGMPPNVDPAQMEKMLDQISPEQMEQQMSMLENLSPEQMRAMGMPAGMDKDQLKMAANMMKGMDKETMKSMTKMAASMRPQMEAMKAAGASGGGGGGGGSSSGGGGGGPAAAAGGGAAPAVPAGMADMMKNIDPSNMDLSQGMDMMNNMSPDMMKAGMEMMKNMDPAMMKNMSKMMGREIDEGQMKQVQEMMNKMSPEDMQKWANRAQKVAGFAQKPVAAYRWCKAKAAALGALGALGVMGALLAVMLVGHVTETF